MKKAKYGTFIAILAFLIFAGISALAQTTSMKIAVVDTDKVFKESVWGKKAVEDLERETGGWQKKGEDLDKKIAELEEKLAKQRAFLENKEEEQKLQNEIEATKLEGQNLIQEGNLRLSEKRQELLEPMLEEIKNLIKKLAMEEGYDLVLEKQLFVLYLNPELDITSKVIVMLDKSYKDKFSTKPKEAEKGAPEKKESKETDAKGDTKTKEIK